MSVVFKKDQLVISIKTDRPDVELANIHQNLLTLLSTQDQGAVYENYWVYWLLKEMLMDENTFQSYMQNIAKKEKIE